MGFAALGERRWKSERPAQTYFLTCHFAIIALMVEARQMEDSVENKNLHLQGAGMAEAAGVIEGNIGRDRDLSCEQAAIAAILR